MTPTEPTPDTPAQIIAEMFESRRLFTWSWRIRFIGTNGEPIGHQYNRIESARRGVDLIVKPATQVLLRIRHRDGTYENVGRIR